MRLEDRTLRRHHLLRRGFARLFIFTGTFHSFFHLLQISKSQFQLNDFDVSHGVDASIHMYDIIIFKTPDHMNNRVAFSDVGEKLIPETCVEIKFRAPHAIDAIFSP